MSKILVTTDLDSSLCDTGHRHGLINRDNRRETDWDAYSMACADDAPVLGMVKVLQLLALNSDIVIVGLSARMSSAEELTLEWMRKHGVPIERVFLDTGEPLTYPESAKGHFHAGYKLARLRQVEEIMGMPVALHFDDYAEVADLFNREGVPTIALRTPQEIQELVEADLKPSPE